MFHNRSYETQRAFEMLRAGKKGDVIKSSDMSEQIGRECWKDMKGYRSVHAAIQRCIKQGVYWYRDKEGQRYVCGDINDINKAQQSLLKQSNKRAKKSLDVALCCETSEMNDQQKMQHNLNTLIAGLVVTATSTPTRKKLDGRKVHQPKHDDLLKLITGEE